MIQYIVWMCRITRLITGLVILSYLACVQNEAENATDWPVYSSDKSGSKYSRLDQINVDNVEELSLAWTYSTGDARHSPASTIQCNPIVVEGVMYVTTPGLMLVALDAASGREIWKFDPSAQVDSRGVNRGVTFWSDGHEGSIFFVAGSNLFAVSAADGALIESFGDGGVVDLYAGLGREVRGLFVTAATPGIIYDSLLIMGTTLGEGPGPAAPGHIRAYDVKTGEIKWTFYTIPRPGEYGYETWSEYSWLHNGGANPWGGFTLDEEKGIVFCGTGSASYDHWGGNRLGENLFANCILALDAATGERIWHFQAVHHDIWDYDIPCPPNLVEVEVEGEVIEAVAQPTKMGHLFVLERTSGKPVFPIEERKVPASQIPGEETWPTQPFPPEGLRYAVQGFTHENVTTISETSAEAVRSRLDSMDTGDIFLPPSEKGAVVLPQFNGGTDWGGAAYDPEKRWLFVNASNEAEWISMQPSEPPERFSSYSLGERIYQSNCQVCHGADTTAQPGSHSLVVLRSIVPTRSKEQLDQLLKNGRGQMPGFGTLTNDEKKSLLDFLHDRGKSDLLNRADVEMSFAESIPYVATGHNVFKDLEGFPVNAPPWGTLSAIDLDKGAVTWQIPLGTYPELEARGFPPTGTFNMGGPLVTAGNLVFIAASMDERFHAFDSESGKMLWEYQMEAGGYATPATYEVQDRQYVVIAAGGGGKPGTKAGDTYYCFALPE